MIFNMVGGGGGSGATLVVSSPANVSVTVSKDDKSYTKNSGSLGSAIFKGLVTGTWAVVISGNGQTATKTIEITADYAITIAFFSATINITYPANSNCVVANSGGQTVASDTNTGTSAKTWTATVNATGTYTVTATATDGSGKTDSTTVSITTNGQTASATLEYDFIIYSGNTKSWNGGYQLTSLSSDWGNATIQNDKYPPYFGGNTGKGARLNNTIDVSEYSQLVIDCQYTGNQWYAFGLIPSSGAWSETNWSKSPGTEGMVAFSSGESAFDRKIQTLDISKLTGNYVFKGEYYSDPNAQFKIYDFRLKR